MDKQKQVLILPGDGIGPEVCDEAKKVFDGTFQTRTNHTRL